MAKEYKIWVYIEEYDTETDDYTDMSPDGLPECRGPFDSEAAALAHMQRMLDLPETETE